MQDLCFSAINARKRADAKRRNVMKNLLKVISFFVSTIFLVIIGGGCGGGSAAGTYTIGGTVTGLTGTLVMQCNGADDLTVTADGAFTFATALADKTDYTVTVLTQPAAQTCTIVNGTGTLGGANVTNVTITCSVNSYTVGGTVTGLVGTLILQNNGGDDLTLTDNGAFTFTTAVAYGSGYDVTVSSSPLAQSCPVTNDTGTMSGANVTDVTVDCSNKAWTSPVKISPDGYDADASTQRVAMKGDVGNAVVVWIQYNGSDDHTFMSEYRNGSWMYPVDQDDHISINDGSNAHAAMDESGNAIVVWDGSDGSNNQIFMSEYRNGAWTHPSNQTDNISPDGQDAYNPWVAMDDNGNAIIVWEQRENTGTYYQIFKSEYRNGSWTHPSDLTSSNYISPDGASSRDARVAMDNNGNAIIIWRQDNDSGPNSMVFMSEYRGGNWTHPASRSSGNYISPDGTNVSEHRVAMSDNGDAVITWVQPANPPLEQIFMSEYRNGSWTHPGGLMIYISPDLPGGAKQAGWSRVAMDDSGNTIIVWEQWEDTGNYHQIFKSEYRNGSWTHPANLVTDYISPADHDSGYPDVAMDNNGQAIIAWSQENTVGDYMIFKSEYRSGSWTDPADIDDYISTSGQDAWEPHVAMDPNGDAIIAWGQSDGSNDQIFMSEYR